MRDEWNKSVVTHFKTKKPMVGLLKMLFRSNKLVIPLLLLVPIASLCGIASPISVKALTSFLTPGSFYNCD
jgi:hypothetical protein